VWWTRLRAVYAEWLNTCVDKIPDKQTMSYWRPVYRCHCWAQTSADNHAVFFRIPNTSHAYFSCKRTLQHTLLLPTTATSDVNYAKLTGKLHSDVYSQWSIGAVYHCRIEVTPRTLSCQIRRKETIFNVRSTRSFYLYRTFIQLWTDVNNVRETGVERKSFSFTQI